MIIAVGVYHDGNTSAVYPVQLKRAGNDDLYLQSVGGELIDLPATNFNQLRISSRVGNTPRHIYFPAAGKFETEDNDAIDRWLSTSNQSLLTGFVHRFESQFRYVLPALLFILFAIFISTRYLIPALSSQVVKQLPGSVNDLVGEGSLALLDQHFFKPSRLSREQQSQLQKLFSQYFRGQPAQKPVTLYFRYSDAIGANAFALPSGDLLLTDEIVNLAASDDELLSVMAHEMGHIHYRHIMRRLVQESLLVFMVTVLTGDISMVSSIVLSAPGLLLEMAYSREFEREADQYALAFLQQQQIDTVSFSNMMLRLERVSQHRNDLFNSRSSQGQGKDNRLADRFRHYLSSHPDTRQRIIVFGEPTI